MRRNVPSPPRYDVPACAADVPGCSRVNGSWVHTISGTFNRSETSGKNLVAAHFHCHAPTCLSVALYRCPPGTKVCDDRTGDLLCREEPVYGGASGSSFDEFGFILQPPCLWGDAAYGLEAPPETAGHVFGAVKTANATAGHHGEMAWLQMYVAS